MIITEETNNFNNDLLERKQIAINLTNILKCKDDLNVLAIDSSWGTGKTTFINMWIDMLKNTAELNSKFEIMYFNAWENDYVQDPLISLLSEINNQINVKQGKSKSFFEMAKPYAKIGSQIALKYLSKGVISSFNIDNNVENGLVDLSTKIGEYKIQELSAAKSSRIALKDNLKDFQDQINKKVIIFIDELDRCKPTYAIELLETIKHIFNLNNYIFVISLDKEQLSYSIKTLYGEKMDSEGYLRRFFDLEYHLPNNNLDKYINSKNSKISQYKNIVYLTNIMSQIFILENYALRDINKSYDYMSLLIPNIDFLNNANYKKTYIYTGSFLYCYFINLRIKHSKIYNDIIHYTYTPSIEYITNNLLTFDLKAINLNIPNVFADEPAKQLLDNVIQLFLILLYKSGNHTDYILPNNESKNFTIGIRDEYNSNILLHKVNLLSFIKDTNIINNLEFISNFVIN